MSLLIFPPLILIATIAERPRRYPAYRKRVNHFEAAREPLQRRLARANRRYRRAYPRRAAGRATTKKRLPISHIDKRR